MRVLLPTACLLLSLSGCQRQQNNSLTVFFAGSLDAALRGFVADYQRDHPNLTVNLELGGSMEVARKVSDYGRRADLLFVADYAVIDRILKPAFANCNIRFCSNAIVLAYTPASRHRELLTEATWPQVLLKDDVVVARADERLGPIGYQTLLTWKLADLYYPASVRPGSVYETLKARVPEHLVVPDVLALGPLLGTEADYVFTFRSVAHDQNLEYLELPPQINLGSPEFADYYARVSVTYESPGAEGTAETTVRGAPIVYGVSIPTNAENPEGAAEFLKAFLGDRGRAHLADSGFTPLPVPLCDAPEKLPPALRPLVRPVAPKPGGSRP